MSAWSLESQQQTHCPCVLFQALVNRMELLARFRYIFQSMRPQAATVVHMLKILSRVAQHSGNMAYEVIRWSNLIWFHFYDEDAHIVFVIFIIGKTLENISKVTVYDCVSDGGFNGIFYLAVVLWDEHPTNFLPFLIDVFLYSFFCSHILITPLKWSPRWTLTHHEHYVK